ncbi:MAG: hypothetical protein ACIARR_06445 [Phycisphaerales bacterium JB059]
MNATTIKNVLEQCKANGDRVAVGFAHRSFFVEDIQSIDHGPTDADDTLFTGTALVYDTGHSRQATPEVIYFQASEVVSLARPAGASA